MADPFAALVPNAAPGQWTPGMPVQPLASPFDHLIPTQAQRFDPREHGVSGAIDATLRTVARGVPVLGQLADEGSAAVNATLAPLVEPLLDLMPGHDRGNDIAGGKTWGDRFSRSVAMHRAMDEQLDTDHPYLSAAGRVAGTVAGSVAGAKLLSPVSGLLSRLAPSAGLLPAMLANGADGALVGGSMGYLGGTGGVTDQSRLSGAGQGAMFGGAAGAAVAPAMSAAKGLWGVTGQHLADALRGPVRVGAAQLSPEIEHLGAALQPTPPTVEGVGQQTPVGPNSTQPSLAEALMVQAKAPTVTAPASAVSGAYDRIYRAAARGGATPDAAIAQTQRLGPFGMLADTSVPMTDLARTVADAPGQSGQMAKDALNLRQSGEMSSGQYTVRPSSQRIGDTLAQALGVSGRGYSADTEALLAQQKADSAPAYAKAYAAPPINQSALQDFSSSPMFTDAYNRARSISQKEFVTLPDGSQKLMPLPAAPPQSLDWRTLDLMKQGMDDGVREGKVAGIGANDQRATTGYIQKFVGTLDGINPDYAAARQAFAGPAKSLDALEAGRAYMSEDAPAVASHMAALGPSEQQAYRVGALQAERDRLGGVPDTYNAAMKAGVNTPNRLAKLQQLFPDAASYGKYADMLGNEATMFATRNRVLGGSLTSKNLSHAEDAGIDPLEMAAALGEAHHNPAGGIGRLAGMLMKAGNGQGMSEPTANAAGAILFNNNPASFPQFTAGLLEAAKRAALAKALGGASAPAAAAGSSSMAAALQGNGAAR